MKLVEFFKEVLKRKSKNTAFFAKDDEGQWWFFGIYSNKFKDFDGDIISTEAHKEYIEWLKDSGFQPVITVHHMPRAPRWFWPIVFEKYENDVKTLQAFVDDYYKVFGFAKAERVIYVNGFVAVVAKVFKDKEHIAEKLSVTSDLGMSHGFIDKDSSANIFNKYRTFEMSVLRSVRAANPFTLSQVLQKGLSVMKNSVEKGLQPEDRMFLVNLFGEEVVNKFENNTDTGEGILSKVLEYKDEIMGDKQKQEVVETPVAPEAEVETVTEAEVVETPAQEQPEAETEQKEEAPQTLTLEVVATETAKAFSQIHEVLVKMQQQLETVTKENGELRKQLDANMKEVSEIKKSDDEKIAAAWLPTYNWNAGFNPSKDADNVIKDEKEKEQIVVAPPAGSQPKEVDPENPLVLGFYSQLPAIMSGK